MVDLTEMDIATRLKMLRVAHGFSQQDVAEKIDASKRSVVAYETGTRIPNDEKKHKLASLYGVNVQRLFFDGVYN